MVDSLSHRGPDEKGAWSSDLASLGIARLSIIDVAEGHQPTFSTDKSIVVVCNGEIYNFQALAEGLRSQGVTLKSHSDVEVIPHLYERHGLEFVHHLRGMFAIALWDSSRQRLVLARDRVGKKPLLYAQDGEKLIFASEARALRATGWAPTVNLDALDHLLAFAYLPIDSGVFHGLRSLPPGHLAIWEAGSLRVIRYWDWVPDEEPLPMAGLGSLVEGALDEAVRIRLVSERPLGALLSGGIDSTIVTAMMARHHSGPVKTFSIGFHDTAFDESGFARGVADYLGTDHTELVVDPDPATIFSHLAGAFDQPFADSSAIPSLLLSELVSEHVVVALAGDGGDEAFGGYDRYAAAPRLQQLNGPLHALGPVTATLAPIVDQLGTRRMGRLVRELRPQPTLGDRYRSIMQYLPRSLREQVWTAEALAAIETDAAEARFMQAWSRFDGFPPLNQMRATDVVTYLPGDLLTKVDVASMSCSLEVRSPFLDQEVLRLAAQLPAEALIRGRTTKWILRQLAYRLVPRHLVDRPKRGFAIPRAAWLRGPLREASRDLLLGPSARHRGWFNTGVVEGFLDEHDRGIDHDTILWPLIAVELWAQRWLDA